VRALIRFPLMLYKLIAWMFDANGNPSKNLINGIARTGSYMFSSCLQSEDGTLLLCDGREVSRTDFPDLFTAIGETYGTPSGGSVFKIPDMRARFPVGLGTFAAAGAVSLGVALGADRVTLIPTNLPPHDHSDGIHKFLLKAPYVGSVTGSDTVNSGTEQAVGSGDGASIQNVGSSVPFNIIPPALGVYVYIFT